MPSFPFLWNGEQLGVAAGVVGQLRDVHSICPVFIPGMWQGDGLCLVGKLNGFGRVVDLPVAVEVDFLSLCLDGKRRGDEQHCGYQLLHGGWGCLAVLRRPFMRQVTAAYRKADGEFLFFCFLLILFCVS